MKITKELFEESVMLEDALQALTGGYFDTHDLDYIEVHKDEYEERLIQLRQLFNLKEQEFFCNFTFEKINKL